MNLVNLIEIEEFLRFHLPHILDVKHYLKHVLMFNLFFAVDVVLNLLHRKLVPGPLEMLHLQKVGHLVQQHGLGGYINGLGKIL